MLIFVKYPNKFVLVGRLEREVIFTVHVVAMQIVCVAVAKDRNSVIISVVCWTAFHSRV